MKIKLMLKRILISIMVVVSIVTATLTTIPIAKADTDILGTNAALGSPVLNNNFVIEDWNKWEFVCWGVYLSNFCVPLLDDYNSAFKTGAGGTNGRGYEALCFGSGSDSANNEVIQALCDEAIVNQLTSTKEIYVTYGNYYAHDEDAEMRVATFRDLFFQVPESSLTDDDTTNITYGAVDWIGEKLDLAITKISGPVGAYTEVENYTDMSIPSYANIPTFYIKKADGTPVKVFDYRNAWDLQVIGAILNAIPSNFTKEFEDAFKDMWDANNKIELDSFANITVNGKMIIPSSCNQYITKTESINLLNSFIFNSYVTTTTDEDLILGLRQLKSNSAEYKGLWNTAVPDLLSINSNRKSGNPAMNETSVGNI